MSLKFLLKNLKTSQFIILKQNIKRRFYRVFSFILTYFKGHLELAKKAKKDYVETMKAIKKLAFHVGALTTYIVWFTRVRRQMIAERKKVIKNAK